jgi:hypothetical protein
VRKQLKACLRKNADLFAWSAVEMPELDPEVACHQLIVDPDAIYVVQRRRKQSPEKEEAVQKVVQDLLEANFISEARYTTCCLMLQWLKNLMENGECVLTILISIGLALKILILYHA